MGATIAHNIQDGPVAGIQKSLGMKEGFDVGLEMSGSGDALKAAGQHVPRREDRPARHSHHGCGHRLDTQ